MLLTTCLHLFDSGFWCDTWWYLALVNSKSSHGLGAHVLMCCRTALWWTSQTAGRHTEAEHHRYIQH